MFRIKKVLIKLATFGSIVTILFSNFPVGAIGIGTVEVHAATVTVPTIRMGDNAPMTFAQFNEWRNDKGIRFFNLEGSIYPSGIFFNWGSGQAFSYGEIRDGALSVTLVLCNNADNANMPNQGTTKVSEPDVQNAYPSNETQSTPIIITDFTPILLSYDELSALIENVPHQNPLDVRSAITLPNRRLTEYELAAWIEEYNKMGGITAFELSVIREINRVRIEHGLNPLALDPALMLAARFKTQEFGDLQYFSHVSPIHGGVTEAARLFGFDGRRVSETITRSGGSNAPVFRDVPEGIVRGMLASSRGHREILLNPNASSVGFGAFFSPNSTGPNGRMSHMFYFATQFGFYD